MSTTVKAVYTVVERGAGKKFWIRIGTGVVNADGSITVTLDAFPANRTIEIRGPFGDVPPVRAESEGA